MLLIDDNELTLKMTSAVLVGAGYEVRTTTSVDQVSESLGDWRPDVILTDVEMPGTTGVELCRSLKAAYESAHVPVVLYSALPVEELEVLARTCEADGFLSKRELTRLPHELAMVLETQMF